MKQAYLNKTFRADSLAMIKKVNEIIGEYQQQGYVLTVRQLYYQLVARDVIPNNVKSYNRVKGLVNDARLAGYVDWDAIEDRTRSFIRRSRWKSGADILESVASQFHMDLWIGQDVRPFAIIEKEALAGVLEDTCERFDVPLLAARGYPSVSVLREFVQRDVLPTLRNDDQRVLILHLGDHDPSGIDMTRDLKDRLALLQGGTDGRFRVKRIALNKPQIEERRPPPNPAKDTDARFEDYRMRYGDESWELDALDPTYLNRLVEGWIDGAISDRERWDERAAEIEAVKAKLGTTAKSWAKRGI